MKALITVLMRFFASLPLRVQYANAKILEWFFRDVIRYRRAVVEDNIAKAFPQKSEREHREIMRDFYRHLGRMVVEAVWFGGCNSEKKLAGSGLVNITNISLLNDIYKRSRSVLILYTHNSNWEIIGGIGCHDPAIGENCINVGNTVVVYKHLSSPLWDKVFERNRRPPGHKNEPFEGYVESKSLIRYMLTHVDSRKIYLINTDQYPYRGSTKNPEITFMGRTTVTMSGAAAVAAKFSLPVVYLSVLERPAGGYDFTFVPITMDASLESVQFIMDSYYSLLENDIRQQPGGYLWSHRRWKHAK